MIKFREAQVIDNNDPDKNGKVKVRILPEMLDFKETLLPWAGIYHEGNDCSAHSLPEKNSYVHVLIEDWPFNKKIRIIYDDFIEGLYIYNNFSLSGVTELSTQTYPQPYFKKYKDGTIEFHNTSTGEYGILYKGGQYELYDSNGNYIVNVKNKKLKFYNDTTSLKDIIKDLKTLITHIESTGAFLDSQSKSCTYVKTADDTILLTNLGNKIDSLLLD
jgi:hypothetical protein